MYQPALAFFQETLGWTRQKATTLLVAICLVGSFLVMYYSTGGVFRSTLDDWVGTLFIFVLAMIQIIYFSWVHGIERGWKEMHQGAHIRIPTFYKIIMKWVAPTYRLVVFVFFCKNNLGDWIRAAADDGYRQGALALIGVTALVLIGCLVVGEKRWRAQGLDIDDKQPLN
jgi:hypothetical protein